MDILPSGNIFRELQDIQDFGYFSSQSSIEDQWQQASPSNFQIFCVIVRSFSWETFVMNQLGMSWRMSEVDEILVIQWIIEIFSFHGNSDRTLLK